MVWLSSEEIRSARESHINVYLLWSEVRNDVFGWWCQFA